MEKKFDLGDSDVSCVDGIAICEVVLVKLTLKQKKMARKFLLGRHEQLCWTKGSFLQCLGPNICAKFVNEIMKCFDFFYLFCDRDLIEHVQGTGMHSGTKL
jgi:hypothetical protein